MKPEILQNLKDNGFIFRKYTEKEQEETFSINEEVLIVPTILELIKSGNDYFNMGDKLDTKDEIANTWIIKNQEKQQETINV